MSGRDPVTFVCSVPHPQVNRTSMPAAASAPAMVHGRGAVLSPAAQVLIEVATRHIQPIAEPV